MERRIAPIIVVTVSLLAVFAMLAILRSATRAGAVTGQFGDPARLFSIEPAGPIGVGLSVDPTRQGNFLSAGESTDFSFSIKNTSDTLSDVFEIEVVSVWPTELFQGNGTTLLIDGNNNGLIDTRILQPGQSIKLFARINAPATASIGDDNRSTLRVTSSNDPLIAETIILQTAIPAPFAQAFRDQALSDPSIFLAQTDNQGFQAISTPDGRGSEFSVAETVQCRM